MEYPLTYEQFEKEVYKRVSELPWKGFTPEEKIEVFKRFMNDESPNFIKGIYESECVDYDNNITRWKKIGISMN